MGWSSMKSSSSIISIFEKELKRSIPLLGLLFCLAPLSGYAVEKLPRCLYISSYHMGYSWSDGVEEGIRTALDGLCEMRQFDMDTKRQRSPEAIEKAVEASIQIINSWKPDVVITSDDNAAKYLIMPHFKDNSIPFVFSGINWTVEEYGFPYKNVTGIVEVAPIEPMLREAVKLSDGKTGIYIGADTLTEEKNYSRIRTGAVRIGSRLERYLVPNKNKWKEAFLKASQTADYIVMGSNSGIEGWDDTEMAKFVSDNANLISVTNHKWMMPFTVLGYTKLPEEHGEWAAQAALEIISGTPATEIPIVTNRRWDIWLNQSLIELTGTELSSKFSRRAKKYASLAE